jgi:hypothetical protein
MIALFGAGTPSATVLVPSCCSRTTALRRLDSEQMLYVHVLHPHDIDAVRQDLERLVTLAVPVFGSSPRLVEEHVR